MLLVKHLWNSLKNIEEVRLNSDVETGLPNLINISFNYVEGESLVMALKIKRIKIWNN